jgi:hypothetical protein
MKINFTGIGPMLSCAKGRDSLIDFSLDRLWQRSENKWFNVEVDLGSRGFKYFNAATCYFLAAIKDLEHPTEATGNTANQKGVIIGSNSCTRKDMNELDRTLLQHGYSAIHPMYAPSFCPNVGAGNVSIKHKAKALNITLTNPITAGLESVILAKQAILDGRAMSVIAGAMEDDSEFTLGQYPVITSGGAWAFRLESESGVSNSATNNQAIARVGETLSCFIPKPDYSSKITENQVLLHLENQLAPLLRKTENLRISVAMLMDAYSIFVFNLLKLVLSKYGIEITQIEAPKKDTVRGTLLAMAHISWMCLNCETGVCIAISPLGQLTALEIHKV